MLHTGVSGEGARSRSPLARVTAWLTAAGLVLAASLGPLAAEPPKRIVSLNLCTDQLLIDLVAPQRISALSQLAADPALSAVADRVEGIRLVRGSAEEVLALEPDLVIAGEHSTPTTVAMLRRLGLDVLTVPTASDFAGIRTAIRAIADKVGEAARGEQLIADFDARLAAARVADTVRPTALAYQINSLTADAGSLLDLALETAGYRNLARSTTLGPGGRLPLETLVVRPPDLVVLANAPDAFLTVSADNLRHPALKDLLERRAHVLLEMPLWLCGTPRIAEAIERLRALRGKITVGEAGR